MEVETAALFAIGIYFLDRSGPGKPDLKFWIVAGLVGWLKSPLHSVLLGSSAILFWASQGELWPRAKSPQAWLNAMAGIAICALGYAPAFLFDRENFVATYILRETLYKPANGAPWHYPIIPLFTNSLFPWMLPAIVAYADGFSRIFLKKRAVKVSAGSKRVLFIGLATIIPSVLFFMWHPYRGQNYNLPVMGGLVLVVASLWATRSESWSVYYSLSLLFSALLLILGPALLLRAAWHFDPMPFWLPSWELPAVAVAGFFTARGFWREGFTLNMARPAALAGTYFWFAIAIGILITTIGEREMIDIRDRIYTAKKNNEKLTIAYYNLQKNIWCEWGYLNFMIPYPVHGLFSEKDLELAVKNKELIIVPGEEWMAPFQEKVLKLFPNAEISTEPWRRWKTKGKNAAGITRR